MDKLLIANEQRSFVKRVSPSFAIIILFNMTDMVLFHQFPGERDHVVATQEYRTLQKSIRKNLASIRSQSNISAAFNSFIISEPYKQNEY